MKHRTPLSELHETGATRLRNTFVKLSVVWGGIVYLNH